MKGHNKFPGNYKSFVIEGCDESFSNYLDAMFDILKPQSMIEANHDYFVEEGSCTHNQKFQHGSLAISHKPYLTFYAMHHLEFQSEIEVAQNIVGMNYGVGVRCTLPKIKAPPSENPTSLMKNTPCHLALGLGKEKLCRDHMVKGGFHTNSKGCNIIHESTAGSAS